MIARLNRFALELADLRLEIGHVVVQKDEAMRRAETAENQLRDERLANEETVRRLESQLAETLLQFETAKSKIAATAVALATTSSQFSMSSAASSECKVPGRIVSSATTSFEFKVPVLAVSLATTSSEFTVPVRTVAAARTSSKFTVPVRAVASDTTSSEFQVSLAALTAPSQRPLLSATTSSELNVPTVKLEQAQPLHAGALVDQIRRDIGPAIAQVAKVPLPLPVPFAVYTFAAGAASIMPAQNQRPRIVLGDGVPRVLAGGLKWNTVVAGLRKSEANQLPLDKECDGLWKVEIRGIDKHDPRKMHGQQGGISLHF
jgi:hypothetical protein